MSDQARPFDQPFDAVRDSQRPSSLPTLDGSRRRRRRRRTDKKRRHMARELAFWIFALVTVLVVTYIGLKLNEGGPP